MCMALAVYSEARGEPYKGQVAVASVVLNRATKNNTDVCTEINKNGQFPWAKTKFKKVKGKYHLIVNHMKPDDAWFSALTLASNMLEGTEKAIPKLIAFDSKPHPEWKLAKAYKIGNHHFYKES